jgi:rhodanese-related sulfurtransferase
VSLVGGPGYPQIPEIEVAEAFDERTETFLVDVREPHEWAAGHVEGARHLPLGLLAAAVGDLPADRRIAVICRSGARSGRATEALLDWGFDAVNVGGGMQAWAAAGLPIVRDDGSPGSVA